MTSRRAKMDKISQHVSSDNDISSENSFPKQSALSTLYNGIAMLHLGEIALAYQKSGFTLGFCNIVGGFLMAAGIMSILGNAALNERLANDTYKKLNGLMFLYSTMSLGLVALVPQLHNPFGLLWFVTSSSSFFVATKGYLTGIDVGDKSFWEETLRLWKGAVRTTTAFPTTIASLGYLCSLGTVVFLKASAVGAIIEILSSSSGSFSSIRSIAPKLSQLTKLTILGGSLVILRDAAHRHWLAGTTFIQLNVLTCYVFGSMAAFAIMRASTSASLAGGCILAFCSIVSGINGMLHYWLQRKKLS